MQKTYRALGESAFFLFFLCSFNNSCNLPRQLTTSQEVHRLKVLQTQLRSVQRLSPAIPSQPMFPSCGTSWLITRIFSHPQYETNQNKTSICGRKDKVCNGSCCSEDASIIFPTPSKQKQCKKCMNEIV